MSDTPITSPYVQLIHSLQEMQESPAYAVRKSVLISAEDAILWLERDLAAKTAECEALREDAERWRWWRAKYPIHMLKILNLNYENMDDKTIDEATDTARKETP